jgi:hypothetical protein
MAAVVRFILIVKFLLLENRNINYDDCGSPTWKWDGCPGLDKFFKFEWFKNCTKNTLTKLMQDCVALKNEKCHARKLGVPHDVTTNSRSSFSDALTSKEINIIKDGIM